MRKKKVLIIEDDAGIQELIRYILEVEGFEVATSAHSLTADLTSHKADIIILDEWVNKKEGTMLCKEIKHVHVTKHIPVIIISTAMNIEEIAENCEADGFIAKPFDIDDVAKEVKKVLGIDRTVNSFSPSYV
jgi:DNA-binding NtrC family response regulator